jgi:hypothetical protein
MLSKRGLQGAQKVPCHRSGRTSIASTHADGSACQNYKQTEETTSKVAAVGTNICPSRNIKRPKHHDGTPLTSVTTHKKNHAAATTATAATTAAAAAAAAATEKDFTKKAKKEKDNVAAAAAAATKKANDEKTADEETQRLALARTCVLKSVDEEGRTAQVLYEDGEDNELVLFYFVQNDFDLTPLSKDDDSIGRTLGASSIVPASITTTNKSSTDGASNQSEQVALLKTIQEQMLALSQKLNEPNAKEKKSTEPKRAVGTCAQSVPQMKDKVVRWMYDVLAKYTEQIQFNSQFKSQDDRDYHPPFWTVVMNVDKLVLNPSAKGVGSRYEKANPVVNMFAQPGIPVPELARILRNATENMEKGVSEGWTLVSGTEEFITNTFGPRSNSIPPKKKELVTAMVAEREELEQQEKEEEATAAMIAALEPNPNQKKMNGEVFNLI